MAEVAPLVPGRQGTAAMGGTVGGEGVVVGGVGGAFLHLEERDGEGGAGVGAAACFGQVSRRLSRLLKRLPKSRSWSDSLRMLRRSSSNGSLLNNSDCNYTCHLECERRVQLDCNQRDKSPQRSSSLRDQRSSSSPSSSSSSSSSATVRHKQNEAKEEEERGKKELSGEEVRTRIEEYNSQVSDNKMNMSSVGSYTGFIRVHLRLSRPVTVPSVDVPALEGGNRLASGGSQVPSESQGATNQERTSFYLPSDCAKQLHISSHTTTREVIQALLKKFMVLDNPCKFALYKQTHRDGQALLQKLPQCDHPLLLRLIAGPDPDLLSFILKENETGEVEWHAFSVPELQNFLIILEKEEAERVRAVEQKYNNYRQRLQLALEQHDL
ncbi:ras association domain-containing protein 5 isoform X2 [Nelusetta ayraudi]|uniref:ras association domain-containing protein 5 isoform X2 n=1 Tax=Nelusetta ayraudi TaxID=303726 RepID=UPI003F6F74A4